MHRLLKFVPLLFANALLAEEPIQMGPAWFARLQDPRTRIEALYELDTKVADGKYKLDDPEEFAANHHQTLVFPCPQPGLKGAWAVVTFNDWDRSREILLGPEAETYPPHPLEVERQAAWEAGYDPLKPGFQLWQPGQPWLEGLSGFMVDETGTRLGEGFFGSPCVTADFDGDGMLDLLEVSRHHVEIGNDKEKSALLDCLEIGPLADGLPRRTRVFANLRKGHAALRPWRFAVRKDAEGEWQVALVPEDKTKEEIVFRLENGEITCSVPALPKGIWWDRKPVGDKGDHPSQFLKAHGMKYSGVGSDSAKEIEAGRPNPPAWDSFEGRAWTLPETKDLPPREAALAMARHQFDPATLRHYEIAAAGEPVKEPTTGWLERWCDGGGWADDFTVVWWLNNASAEQWAQKDHFTFLFQKMDAEDVRRRIVITHELDRVRSVPMSPVAPADDHDQMGGDDMVFFRVRALSPGLPATVFDEFAPILWKWVGSRYDRRLASAVAVEFAGRTPETGEPRLIRDLAPLWLAPDNVAKVPPGLSRAAVSAIGKNRWQDLRPLLEKLQTSFGPLSEDEKKLTEIESRIRKNSGYYKLQGKAEWLAARELRKAEREKVALVSHLTGNPAFELREAIKEAFAYLDTPQDSE